MKIIITGDRKNRNYIEANMISIFTSCYNQGRYLTETIESVLGQSYSDFEYLLYDDGSIDNTWEIMEVYAKRDSRIKVVKLPKQPNVGYVINRSFEDFKRDFWVWVPSDDILESNCLEEKMKESEKYDHSHVLYSYWTHINEAGNAVGKVVIESMKPEDYSRIIWERCPIGFTGIWIPRTVIEKVGPFPTHLHCSEDYYWMIKATIHGTKFNCINKFLYRKRLHSNRLISRYAKDVPNLVAQIRKELKEYKEKYDT